MKSKEGKYFLGVQRNHPLCYLWLFIERLEICIISEKAATKRKMLEDESEKTAKKRKGKRFGFISILKLDWIYLVSSSMLDNIIESM